MSVSLDAYLGLVDALDDSDDYVNSGEEFTEGEDRYVVVTQIGSKFGGGQVLFQIVDGEARLLDADTVTANSLVALRRSRTLSAERLLGCQARSDADHDAMASASAQQANQFSSANGPDGGNLACVWALRHIVYAKLGVWITRTDATARFATELVACFKNSFVEDNVRAGGIVISPTGSGTGRARHGHVGLLGSGTGDDRLIYSNSSRNRRWEQNFTVGSWRDRYVHRLGLDLFFFPLPQRE